MEAPTFTKKPKKAEVKEGTSAIFECSAKGKPIPEVKWYVLTCYSSICGIIFIAGSVELSTTSIVL